MVRCLFIYHRPRKLRDFGFSLFIGKNSWYLAFNNYKPRLKYSNSWKNLFMTDKEEWRKYKDGKDEFRRI